MRKIRTIRVSTNTNKYFDILQINQFNNILERRGVRILITVITCYNIQLLEQIIQIPELIKFIQAYRITWNSW